MLNRAGTCRCAELRTPRQPALRDRDGSPRTYFTLHRSWAKVIA